MRRAPRAPVCPRALTIAARSYAEPQLGLWRRIRERTVIAHHGERRELVHDRLAAQPEVQHLPALDPQGVGDQAPVAAPPLRHSAHDAHAPPTRPRPQAAEGGTALPAGPAGRGALEGREAPAPIRPRPA